MRPLLCTLPEQEVVLSLEQFSSYLRIDRPCREIGELNTLLAAEPFAAEKRPIRERYIPEVPGMRMLAVEPAEIAFELAALDLPSLGTRCGDDVRLFNADPVFCKRDIRV